MNHEQSPGGVLEPRHRAETPAGLPTAADRRESDAAADAYVADVVSGAPTPEIGQIIADLYRRQGTAYALYLSLDGVDIYGQHGGPGRRAADRSTIEADFASSYHGYFRDRAALTEDVIAVFGWAQDLDRLLQGKPDLQMALAFDRNAIYEFASEHFKVIDTGQGIYVYGRWP